MRNVPNMGYMADPYREKLSLVQYLKSPIGAQTAQGHIPHLSPREMICTAHREKLIPGCHGNQNHQPTEPKLQPDTEISQNSHNCVFRGTTRPKNRQRTTFFEVFLCGFNHTANASEEGERERDLWREKVSLSSSSALFRRRMKSHFVGWLENDAAT